MTIDQLTTGSSNFLRPCPWEELILGEGSDEANRQLYLFQIFQQQKMGGNFRLIVGVLINSIYVGVEGPGGAISDWSRKQPCKILAN